MGAGQALRFPITPNSPKFAKSHLNGLPEWTPLLSPAPFLLFQPLAVFSASCPSACKTGLTLRITVGGWGEGSGGHWNWTLPLWPPSMLPSQRPGTLGSWLQPPSHHCPDVSRTYHQNGQVSRDMGFASARMFISPKRPGRLADSFSTCPNSQAGKGGDETEISLSQKQQIQQLWLLQETQICTGLISLSLYHHTESKSYYALSGGQGLTSSGIGKMIPWPTRVARGLLPQHSHCRAPCRPSPGQTPSLPPWTPESQLPSRNWARLGPHKEGRNRGQCMSRRQDPHRHICLRLENGRGSMPGSFLSSREPLGSEQLPRRRQLAALGKEVPSPNLEFLCQC